MSNDICKTRLIRGRQEYICGRQAGHPGMHYGKAGGKHFTCTWVWQSKKGEQSMRLEIIYGYWDKDGGSKTTGDHLRTMIVDAKTLEEAMKSFVERCKKVGVESPLINRHRGDPAGAYPDAAGSAHRSVSDAAEGSP